MLKPRRHLPTYPDGVMEVYRKPSGSSSRSACVLPDSTEGLDKACTLCYSVEAMRERDIDADTHSHLSITSMAIKTKG